uniref:Polyprotein n=1 Tax=Rhizophora mucronata TaxID=61149 RepID=A0A2P2K1E3_RHIMU
MKFCFVSDTKTFRELVGNQMQNMYYITRFYKYIVQFNGYYLLINNNNKVLVSYLIGIRYLNFSCHSALL